MRPVLLAIAVLIASPVFALDFRRGDCNFDLAVDISDPIYLLDHLFGGAETPSCLDSCDSNDDGALDVGDAITLLNLLFDPLVTSLPPPYPDPGADPSIDGLTCGDPSLDEDGDGFTIGDGDCCDTSPLINPGAYDIPGNGIDEDCNGIPDDEAICDLLAGGETLALELVTALDLCRVASSPFEWGLLTAELERADGTPFEGDVQAETITDYGPNVLPPTGSTFAALSTGIVTVPSDPDFVFPSWVHGVYGQPPASYLTAHGGALPTVTTCMGLCPGGSGANDSVSLHLTIRVPTNAISFSFEYYFLSAEFVSSACTQYNDSAIALLETGADVPADQNIMTDPSGDPITVVTESLVICDSSLSCFPCPEGDSGLEGTGFEGFGGGTGWVTATAPVVPGETIDLRIMIWDTSDATSDSVLLLDSFEWELQDPTVPCP